MHASLLWNIPPTEFGFFCFCGSRATAVENFAGNNWLIPIKHAQYLPVHETGALFSGKAVSCPYFRLLFVLNPEILLFNDSEI